MATRRPYQVQRVLYVLLVLVLTLALVYRFITPVVMAATVALGLYPFQRQLESRNWSRGRAASLLTFLFTFVVSIPFIFFTAKGFMLVTEQLKRVALMDTIQDLGLTATLSSLRRGISGKIMDYFQHLPFVNSLSEAKISGYLKSLTVWLLHLFQSFASSIPTLVLFLVIMIASVHSFLYYGSEVRRFFQRLFGFSHRRMDLLIQIFIRDARQVYFSNVVTGAIQSGVIATAVLILLKIDWLLVFFVTLILSFIPVIGAAPMGFLFAGLAFLQGNTKAGLILAFVATFAGVIDNILRPWLVSFGESKAPPVVSFVCVIGGALALGFPGLFIGLMLAAIIYDTLPIFWNEIHREGDQS